ncbi:hypothetical protein OOK44_21925 [Streptomyces cellulosae]|uniref:Secreted protein n=1 Tax=Streptomyces thermodiastaticus TaxID=44061 RepID=A0ABU0K8G3_9ACTN|nr:hypothetical protein [Streptomyces sp. McG7]MCX4479075.1 hypothetical protein [Streptomyces cellulosae]MDQ0485662.1 hypothetical protein [Streptomyces thermodiastaticus]UVT11550.1 hypothetical protein AY578_21170 [Streptomyces thermocarboxydus]WSB43301.1 hypothetical protein OG853_21710 [Streptomyces cellulosae]
MSVRFTTRARTGAVALVVAAGLALGVTGCGGGGDGEDGKPKDSASASKGDDPNPSTQEGADETLAELRGEGGLTLKITSAARDVGGFVTVNGEIKNDSSEPARIPVQASGNETEIIAHGRSLGGATLVDSASKKRYYVLRDTEGRPLTTTNMPRLKPGESIPVFMQFPAPPVESSEVTFQVPTFASGTIQISG